MAIFSYTPDFGANKVQKPKVNTIQFGDGYAQRVSFGINTLPTIWQLTFSNRSASEAQAIQSFFETKKGVTNFDWTPPNESTPKKFICQDWNVTTVKYNNYTITAQFTEVFDA